MRFSASGFLYSARYFEIHPYCDVEKQCIRLHGLLILHCLDGPQFVFPSVDGRLGAFQVSAGTSLRTHVFSFLLGKRPGVKLPGPGAVHV